MLAWSIGSSSWGRTANRRWRRRPGVGGSGIRPTEPVSSRAAEHLAEDRRDPGERATSVDQHPVGVDPAGRRPVRRAWNSPRRRANTRRMPTTAVRALIVVPISGAWPDHQLGGPDQPRQAALRVPVPPEPEVRRMLPGEVLGIAHEARRPEQSIRPRLVEPDAIGRLAGGRPSSSRPVRARSRSAFTRSVIGRRVVERLERDQPGRFVRRRLTLEPDRAGPLRVEDDDRRGQHARPRRRRGSARRRAGGGRPR